MPVGLVKYQSGIGGRGCPARNVTPWTSLVSLAQITVSPTRICRWWGKYLMTVAVRETILPHASEVAALSGAGPAATLTNQPELGMRSCPGPLKLGGAVRTVVLRAFPLGLAVRLFSVKAGGANSWLNRRPVVAAGAPQTPGRIWTA